MEWVEEYRPCPVCKSESYREIGRRGGSSHRDGLGVETMVVKCSGCTARYARPFLIPQGNPYDTEVDYFKIHEPADVAEQGRTLMLVAERLLGRKGRVLELGCGRGILLKVAREMGWETYGVEMTVQFAELAREHGVIEVASAEEAKLLDDNYDLVLMPAILEHLYDPISVLRRVGNALVADGILFLDIPNEASFSFAIGNLYSHPASINLSPTFSPYHVIGFSSQSVATALKLSGFDVVDLATVKYSNALPGGSLKRNIERFAMGIIQSIGYIIGKGDGLVVWARKSS